MSPVPNSSVVSEQMKRMPSQGTKIERALAEEFRRHRYKVLENFTELPGSPDIVLPNQGIAIFLHGCYWHHCPRHGTVPKHNRAWWIEKFARNRARDLRQSARLRRLGWHVYTYWEHTPPDRIVAITRRRIARMRAVRDTGRG